MVFYYTHLSSEQYNKTHKTTNCKFFAFLLSQCVLFKAAAGNTCAVSPPLGQPMSSSESSL